MFVRKKTMNEPRCYVDVVRFQQDADGYDVEAMAKRSGYGKSEAMAG